MTRLTLVGSNGSTNSTTLRVMVGIVTNLYNIVNYSSNHFRRGTTFSIRRRLSNRITSIDRTRYVGPVRKIGAWYSTEQKSYFGDMN